MPAVRRARQPCRIVAALGQHSHDGARPRLDVLRRAVRPRRRRRPRAGVDVARDDRACRTPAPPARATRILRVRTAAARARNAGRRRASVERSRNGSTTIASSMPSSRASLRCSAVKGPPTRTSRTSARCCRTAATTVSSTSIRLRAMVLLTWRRSVVRAARRRAAARLRRRRPAPARGEQLGCGPFSTTLVRAGSTPALATSASRVASVSHATCPAARRPARIRRVIARNSSRASAPVRARAPTGTCRGRDTSRACARPAACGPAARSCGRRCERGRSGCDAARVTRG